MRYKQANIILVSLAVEGFLVGIFLLWAYRGATLGHPAPSPTLLPTAHDLVLGLGFCIPLFIVNFLLFGPLSKRFSLLHSCYEFKDRVVRPLAAELDYRTGLFVALCAGVGEELFFRGVLANEFGIIISSVLFSLMHFGPAVMKFRLVATIYLVIGFYFGWIYSHTGSLWVPIITHAAYDYAALLYMRYLYCPREFSEMFHGVR